MKKFKKPLSIMMAVLMMVGSFSFTGQLTAKAAGNAENHYGDSGIKEYINGDYLNAHFNTAERAKIAENVKVKTLDYNKQGETDETDETTGKYYETSDKLWLPSGNYSSNDQLINYGVEDVAYNKGSGTAAGWAVTSTNSNNQAAYSQGIPRSYWSYNLAGGSTYSWLRSPGHDNNYYACVAARVNYVSFNYVNYFNVVAPALRLNLTSDISAALGAAASDISGAQANGTKFNVDSTNLGSINNSNDGMNISKTRYGMYLKSNYDGKTFVPGTVTMDTSKITVTHDPLGGFVDGDKLMICAFPKADSSANYDVYIAGADVVNNNTSTNVSISGWGLSDEADLSNYAISMWVERTDASKAFQQVTTPYVTTWSGTAWGTPVAFDSNYDRTSNGVTNKRLIALPSELSRSWGDTVGTGNGQTTDGSVSQNDSTVTNQRIYYGKFVENCEVKPIEWWICDNSDSNNDGVNELTLYQAINFETSRFKNAPSDTITAFEMPSSVVIADGTSTEATRASYKQADCTSDLSNQECYSIINRADKDKRDVKYVAPVGKANRVALSVATGKTFLTDTSTGNKYFEDNNVTYYYDSTETYFLYATKTGVPCTDNTEYKIDCSGQTNGLVFASKEKSVYGVNIKATALAEDGYAFDSNSLKYYKADGGSYDGADAVQIVDDAFVMPNYDIKIGAKFISEATKTYNINTAKIGGDSSCKVQNIKVGGSGVTETNSGQDVTFEVATGANYKVVGVYVSGLNGEPTKNSKTYSFTMPANDVTIVASFAKKASSSGGGGGGGSTPTPVEPESYTITVNNSENGTIVADKTETTAGDYVTLTATPDEGYKLDKLTVLAGKEEIPVLNGKFVMPASEVTVSATFVKEEVPVEKSGWQQENNNWYYYKNNEVVKGEQTIEDKTYFFNDDGSLHVGWKQFAEGWKYFESRTDEGFSSNPTEGYGAMLKGWAKGITDGNVGNNTLYWYYLDENTGVQKTGWVQTTDGNEGHTALHWYYMRPDWGGAMMDGGWLNDGGSWYYIKADWGGAMAQSEWVLDNGSWYYVNGNGEMITGWLFDNGAWYYLDTNGVMLTNTWTPDGYFVGADGRLV